MQFKLIYRRSPLRFFAHCMLSLSALLFLGTGFLLALLLRPFLHHLGKFRRVGHWIAFIWIVFLTLVWVFFGTEIGVWGWWIGSAPLAPLIAEVLEHLVPFINRALASDLDELLAYQRRDEQQRLARCRSAARKRPFPQSIPGYIPLAPIVDVLEPFPSHSGVLEREGWLFISETALSQHMFIQGAPGSGKTETFKWLVTQVLAQTDWDVFCIDGKGDEELAAFLVQTTESTRGFRPKLFLLGQGTTGDTYNAFVGQRQDIYNRLVAALDQKDITGGAAYYANANKTLMQLICYAPCGTPRDFADLEQRLNYNWLLKAYAENKQEQKNIAAVKKHIPDLAVWLQPLIRDFRDTVRRDGFTFDSARVGIFSVRTQSAGETSRQLLNILNADLLDFMGKRQQRKTLVIIDEFQAFKNEGLPETLSLGRSSNLAIVLATQDTASIANKDVARRILANTRLKTLMATDFPEEVGQIAGTREVLEHSYQHDIGQVTGVGTSRQQHQHQISLNDVSRLEPGEAFLIRQRYVARVVYRMVQDSAQTINPKIS